MDKLVVDPEFKALIPALLQDERTGLEASIKAEGCRDLLVAWKRPDCLILVDGHNRLEICVANMIPYGVREVEFEDRDEAKLWILRNQLSRRNITMAQRTQLVLMMEPILKAQAKKRQSGGQGGALLPPMSAEASGDTRDRLARLAGVGHDYIDKAKVVLAEADPETKAKVLSGELKMNTAFRELRPESGAAKRLDRAPAPKTPKTYQPDLSAGDRIGKGVILAHEAINCLIRIPKTDPLRKRGFQMVSDWIRANK